MKISLCIATHRRPDRLGALLDDITRQELLPAEVIIVDNDAAGSARAVVEEKIAAKPPYPIHYAIQPQRGIAITRNMTVAMASGDWLAFLDDDERAPAAWLRQMVEAAAAYRADGVLGPVVPVVPDDAPAWIRRGTFYDFPRMKSGEVVPLNRMRFGNVLLRGEPMRAEPGPFNPAYGLMCGEDGDLLSRMANHGARIVWADEAIVHEPVEAKRLSLHWLLQRALSGGQEFARKTLSGTYGTVTLARRVRLFFVALAQMAVAAGLAAASLPAGRHQAVKWLVKASANFGKLSVFWGWRYNEYA
ncbi:MAG TPA: glycosyltransferase family 2 protein [Burkholderiaceae bacterium]|nr:glycosyltransferase family 2 protein [Burkholderiaceae bacterium]